MYRSGNYSPLHLSIRIRNYLKYKAWAEGILVLELRADGTEKQCSICGATGKKSRQCIHLSEWPSGQPFPERRPKPGPQMPGQLPEKATNQVNKWQKCLLYINAEQSAREEAPVTPPFRLNTARRPNAGVAEELCLVVPGCIRSYKNVNV